VGCYGGEKGTCDRVAEKVALGTSDISKDQSNLQKTEEGENWMGRRGERGNGRGSVCLGTVKAEDGKQSGKRTLVHAEKRKIVGGTWCVWVSSSGGRGLVAKISPASPIGCGKVRGSSLLNRLSV